MRRPEFITFTGVDDFTSIEGMAALSREFPIEWGVLFSPKRQGSGRYPGAEAQSRLLWSGLRMAAHLCGEHARRIMDGRPIDIPVDLGFFKRLQINHPDPDPRRITEFRRGWGPRCIAQSRGEQFPADASLDWLHDRSGGEGRAETSWPRHPGRLVGYAGGIGPANVEDVIRRIGADGPYWLDMESGVRTDDRFDLQLCRRVCEIAFSPAFA